MTRFLTVVSTENLGGRRRTSGLTKRVGHRIRSAMSGGSSQAGEVSPHELLNRITDDAYLSFHYAQCYGALKRATGEVEGVVVEVGSGPGFSKRVWPGIVTSDIECGTADVVADAARMPFASESLGALVLKDALHHLPDVETFLREADRVLSPGGRIVILDPYWGPLARFVYRWLHPEPFDPRVESWHFEANSPHDSNQALLFLLLRRDREALADLITGYEIIEHGAIIGPSFLLSGGLYGRSRIPSSWLVKLARFEMRRGRWFDAFRFGYVVALRKEKM